MKKEPGSSNEISSGITIWNEKIILSAYPKARKMNRLPEIKANA